MTRKLAIMLVIVVIASSAIGLLRLERGQAPTNPCLQPLGEKIRIIYMPRRRAMKGSGADGCTLCDADNATQWNTLYKIYGGREEIEFLVIFPKDSSNRQKLDLRYDLGITEDETADEQDRVVLCDRGAKKLENRGVIDMVFVRKAHELLAHARRDRP